VLAELHPARTEAQLSELDPRTQPSSFKEVVELFRDRREMILYSHLQNSVHLVRFDLGQIELRPSSDAPRDLVNRVSATLSEWTGCRWVVTVSDESGDETLGEQARAQKRRLIDEADNDEFVRAVKGVFPGAAVIKVTNREPTEITDARPAEYSEYGDGDEE